MTIKNLANLIMLYLPALVQLGDVDAAEFQAITGREIQISENGQPVVSQGLASAPLYEVIEPEFYIKAALTYAAGGTQTLLNESTDYAQGTAPVKEGRLPKGQKMLITHVLVEWDQIASASAGGATYENTTASLEPELANATIIVEIGSGEAFRVPFGQTQFGTKAQTLEEKLYAIPSPKFIDDSDQVRIKIEWPAAGTGLSALTADTYGHIALYGPRLRKKSNV